jgi:peptidoglycan/xylan/chitin deacetylase (PgdA/CDA1 family)
MKRLALLIGVLFLFPIGLIAQATSPSNWTPRDRNFTIEMLFPGGKSKALILSFDDGFAEDRQLIGLLNKYKLRGSFHLNTGKFGTPGYITAADVATIYQGQEVSVHGYNHIGLKGLSDTDLVYEIAENRRELEQLSGQVVRGMAYPFGSYDERSLATLRGLGIEYARTVNDTYAFGLPSNFLLWNPSAHMFGQIDYNGDTNVLDMAEYAKFTKLTDDFLAAKGLALYYVWGHSWEYKKKWTYVEDFLKRVSKPDEIVNVTNIEMVDYLNAFHDLRISADKTTFYNPSAVEVFVKITNLNATTEPKSTALDIKPGATQKLSIH